MSFIMDKWDKRAEALLPCQYGESVEGYRWACDQFKTKCHACENRPAAAGELRKLGEAIENLSALLENQRQQYADKCLEFIEVRKIVAHLEIGAAGPHCECEICLLRTKCHERDAEYLKGLKEAIGFVQDKAAMHDDLGNLAVVKAMIDLGIAIQSRIDELKAKTK